MITLHTFDSLITHRGHEIHECDFDGSESLAAFLDRVLGGHRGLSVLKNGEVIESATLETLDINDGDELHVGPSVGDPGTLILTAIAIASAAASAALISRVDPGVASSNKPEQQRFGFNRFSNDAFAGDVIPVAFGARPRYGGKVIARVPVESPDGSGDSKVKILICYGHGPINLIGDQSADFDLLAHDAIEDVYLNDQPVSNFPGVKVSGRMGTVGQAILPGFADTETLQEVGIGGVELANLDGVDREELPGVSGDVFQFQTSQAVNAVVIRIRFPQGLYRLTKEAQLEPRDVKYRYRSRVADSGGGIPGAWSSWTLITVRQAIQSEFFSSPRLDDLADPAELMDIQVERVSVQNLENLQVKDRFLWDSVIEVAYSDNTYAGFALLALELTASEQLQTVPRVSAYIEGQSDLRIWDNASDPAAPSFNNAYSNNPAWIALEILTNATWGLGALYGDDNIDFASLFEWAKYCDEDVDLPIAGTRKRFAYNYVLDSHRDGIDWLRAVCRVGRCVPVTVGGRWRFIVDRDQDAPVEVFTDGSIAVDDSNELQMTYRREYTLGAVQRPNRMVVQFENEDQDGEPDALAYPAIGEFWLATESVREESLSLEGVTHPDQAAHEAVYLMNRTRYLTRSVEFVTTKPAVVVQPGDRFDLAVSLTGYGIASGRIAPGSTGDAIRLDRTVSFEAGKSYSVRVVQVDGSLDLSNIIVTGPTTVAKGDAIDLIPPLTQDPLDGSEYAIGEVGFEMKPFLCTGVEVEDIDELRWRIRGIEYVAAVYTGDPGELTVPNYSSLANEFTPPGPVINLRAYERTLNGRSIVELSWNQLPADAQITASFRLYRRALGTGSWVLVPEPKISNRSAVLEIIDESRAYEFVVVAVSINGTFLSPSDPRNPIATMIFGLVELPPPPPENLQIIHVSGNTYRLTWDAVEDAVGYQVLAGGDTTTMPNVGAEDCLVLGRTVGTGLDDLELPPQQQCRFYVRSVGENGRMSFTASTVQILSPLLPAGHLIKNSKSFLLALEGVRQNLEWNFTDSRLELSNANAPGLWTGPEVDTDANSSTELTWRPATANDTDDPLINTDPFAAPTIEADQWGVIDLGPPRVTGMVFPPYPDTQHVWKLSIRTKESAGDNWSEWEVLAAFKSIERTFRYYQAKLELRRGDAPYRPAMRNLTIVTTA